jgi:hypothetical protein
MHLAAVRCGYVSRGAASPLVQMCIQRQVPSLRDVECIWTCRFSSCGGGLICLDLQLASSRGQAAGELREDLESWLSELRRRAALQPDELGVGGGCGGRRASAAGELWRRTYQRAGVEVEPRRAALQALTSSAGNIEGEHPRWPADAPRTGRADLRCIGGERVSNFSSPLSSYAKCLSYMLALLEAKLVMHSVLGEA